MFTVEVGAFTMPRLWVSALIGLTMFGVCFTIGFVVPTMVLINLGY